MSSLKTKSMAKNLPPLKLSSAFLFFLFPTILLFFATHYIVEYLNSMRVFPALSWFISGGLLVFIPLFVLAIILAKREIPETIRTLKGRLRLQPLTQNDWIWCVGSILCILTLMAGLMLFYKLITGSELNPTPFWLEFRVLQGNELWILLIWLVFFFFNIFGEELLWRGYILPRQEANHKNKAWIVNALLWTMFHISFGLNLLIILLPILFILPYAVQKTKNTWVGIIIHTVVNGPSFILISLGIL